MNAMLFSCGRGIAKLLIVLYSAVILLGFVHFVHMAQEQQNSHCGMQQTDHALCKSLVTPVQGEISHNIYAVLFIAINMGALSLFAIGILVTRLHQKNKFYNKKVFPPPYMQELFSGGILHPKSP
jgi:hypothetical protein